MDDKEFAIDNLLEMIQRKLEAAPDSDILAISNALEEGDCVDLSFSIETETGVRVASIWSVMSQREYLNKESRTNTPNP